MSSVQTTITTLTQQHLSPPIRGGGGEPPRTKTLKRTFKMPADPSVLIASTSHGNALQESSHSAYPEMGAVGGKNPSGSLVTLHFFSGSFSHHVEFISSALRIIPGRWMGHRTEQNTAGLIRAEKVIISYPHSILLNFSLAGLKLRKITSTFILFQIASPRFNIMLYKLHEPHIVFAFWQVWLCFINWLLLA